MSLDLGQHLHPVSPLPYPRSADEHSAHAVGKPSEVQIGFEAPHLPAEGVALGGHIEQAQVIAVEHDESGARAECGGAGSDEVAQRLGQALALDAEHHRGGLAAGDHKAVEALHVGRRAHLAYLGTQSLEHLAVCLEVPLEG